MSVAQMVFSFSSAALLALAVAAAEDVRIPAGALAADDQCSSGAGSACSLDLLHHRGERIREQLQDSAPPQLLPGPLLTFYMYRAQNEKHYPLENVNAANLAGVLWYLHHEIVDQYPRRFDVMRILRLKVQMRATPELYNVGMNFGLRYAWDAGQCTSKFGFNATSDHYGFIVGCNKLGAPNSGAYPFFPIPYPNAIWYSLPGKCPAMTYANKTAQCMREEPGGKCSGPPTGAWNCTWSYEDAGELLIEEIYSSSRCQGKCVEYVEARGKGCCTDFWDDYNDVARNVKRTQVVAELFAKKYPDAPSDADLPTPTCDFDSNKYWGLLPPAQHKFGLPGAEPEMAMFLPGAELEVSGPKEANVR